MHTSSGEVAVNEWDLSGQNKVVETAFFCRDVRDITTNSLIALGNKHVANKKAGITVGLLLNLYISYSY